MLKTNKKVHITIVIETFNREITSAILLKIELEKRGYQVSIKRKSEDICLGETDLLILPNGYRTAEYYDYRYRFNCKSGKIVNLQWEQLFSRYEEENNKWLADGKAKELVFLCWGQNRVDRLLGVGVKEKRIFKVGPIHTDTMRNELSYIWKGKKEIADRFRLDKNKKWVLFISSLTFAPSDSTFIRSTKKLIDYVDYNQRHIVEEKTQKEVIEWLENLLNERNDIVAIYRPHPTEKTSPNLMEAQKKYPNRFNVISDLDLKQWITVSDTIVLWNSTSAIECSMANKKCIVVRPYDIENKDEYILYDGCDFSRDYQDFRERVFSKDESFPVSEDMLGYYYDIQEKPSYDRICDVIDRVAKDDGFFNYENNYVKKRFAFLIKGNILGKVTIKHIYCFLHRYFGFSIRNEKLRNKYFFENWEKSIAERTEAISIEKTVRSKMIGDCKSRRPTEGKR